MKYSLFFALASLILLGAACQKPAVQNSNSTNQTSGNSINVNVSDIQNTNTVAGRYVDYSESIIANTTGRKILFFHAPWCPQCRQLEKSITTGVIPENTTIIKVDYDSMQSLRQKYGVTLQTTLVLVDDAGQLVKKFNAYDDPSLNRVVQELL